MIEDESCLLDLSIEDYHASSALSRSKLLELRKSPLHFWHKFIKNNNSFQQPTDSMEFGSALHCYLLEPYHFNYRYFLCDKIDKRTTAGKEYLQSILQEANGRKLLEKTNFDKIKSISDCLEKNSIFTKFFHGGKVEKSIYWADKSTQLNCKVRPDILHNNMVVDLKTTADASFRSFQSSTFKYGYHIQAAMIKEAIKNVLNIDINDFIFIAIEKEEPFAHCVYILDDKALQQGLMEFRELLSRYKECFYKNEWPGYETTFLTLPNYAQYEILP